MITMKAVYTVTSVSRSAIRDSRVEAVASKFMLIRTSRHLSKSMAELMVINGMMVCHNCMDNLLRR